MQPPSGAQHVIETGGYRAVLTESGATLRELTFEGRELVDGFAEDELPVSARGQLLMPWPNRIGDGAYEFAGRRHQLPCPSQRGATPRTGWSGGPRGRWAGAPARRSRSPAG
ncbi:MAG: hypothetical protein R2731_04170 [Nocardioides sp.]